MPEFPFPPRASGKNPPHRHVLGMFRREGFPFPEIPTPRLPPSAPAGLACQRGQMLRILLSQLQGFLEFPSNILLIRMFLPAGRCHTYTPTGSANEVNSFLLNSTIPQRKKLRTPCRRGEAFKKYGVVQ